MIGSDEMDVDEYEMARVLLGQKIWSDVVVSERKRPRRKGEDGN